MNPSRQQSKLPPIDFDQQGLQQKIKYRNDVVRPWIIILLLAGALFATPWGIVNAIRVYSEFGGSLTMAIIYSVVMGVVAGSFLLLDGAYSFGYIGLPTYEELPMELYSALRRFKSHSYIRPFVYYDDRVPRNNIGIWKMRVIVPVTYILSIILYWGTIDGRDAAATTTDKIRFTCANALLVFLAVLQIKIVVSNVYCVINEWDYVPDILASSCVRKKNSNSQS